MIDSEKTMVMESDPDMSDTVKTQWWRKAILTGVIDSEKNHYVPLEFAGQMIIMTLWECVCGEKGEKNIYTQKLNYNYNYEIEC